MGRANFVITQKIVVNRYIYIKGNLCNYSKVVVNLYIYINCYLKFLFQFNLRRKFSAVSFVKGEKKSTKKKTENFRAD